MEYLALILAVVALYVLRDSIFKSEEITNLKNKIVLKHNRIQDLKETARLQKSLHDFHLKELKKACGELKENREALDMLAEIAVLESE